MLKRLTPIGLILVTLTSNVVTVVYSRSSERFDLGTDIKNILYTTLRNIIFAWKEYENKDKLKYLRQIDVDLLVLKSLITISYKYQYITQKNYMVWCEKVSEIGKLVGGWIKSCPKE